MADQFINIAKPFLIQKLTDEIKLHEKEFDVVESKIDSIITQLKTQLEPISKPIIAGIKLIPFGDPTKKLEELSDELKLKMDGIDFSELENIPDIDKTLTDRIKALPDKVKTKLKDLVDELVTGKAPETTTNGTVDASSKVEEATTDAATTTTDTATTTDAAGTITDATMPPVPPSNAEKAAKKIDLEAAKAGLTGMDDDTKKRTIDDIIKMLKDMNVFEEIKTRINVPAPPTAAAAGGAKKRRRKTKKNIRRNNNGKTRFGRTF